MLIIIEWTVWGIAAFVATGITYGAIRSRMAKRPIMKATIYQGIFLWLIVIFLIVDPNVSKLNLIWIVPLCFPLIGYMTFRSARARVDEPEK